MPGRVYLDTNILILGLEAPGPRGAAARTLLRDAVAGRVHGVVGDAVVAELMVGIHRSGSSELESEMAAFLTRAHLTVVSHDRGMFLDAARIRAHHGGQLMDALHVATAIASGCDAIVSHDERMPRLPEMPVLRLDQLDLGE